MRILIVSQWCFPEPDARILNMAEDMISKGHQVEILTGFPNYPGGTIYPGYKLRVFQKETINGVNIKRVWLYPSHDKSSVKRMLNYGSFALSAWLLGPFMVKKPDVIYVYHPPATVAIPALFLKFIFGARMVYDIQDLWPDSIEATGMIRKKGIIRLLDRFQNFIYRRADAITVISGGFKKRLLEKGVPEQKVHVVWNWSIPIGFSDAKEDRVDFGKKFTVLFAGNHGNAQRLDTIIAAAELLSGKEEQDIQFAFLGSGPVKEDIVALAKSKGLNNVLFLDRVSPEKAGNYLVAADVLLVHLKDDPLFRITIPSKTQSYLMIGKPVLAGVKGDAADLLVESGGGLVFEPEQAADLVEKLNLMHSMSAMQLEEMGRKGKVFYYAHLDRTVGTDKFLKIFSSLKK